MEIHQLCRKINENCTTSDSSYVMEDIDIGNINVNTEIIYYMDNVYICPICNDKQKRLKKIIQHILTKHGEYSVIRCKNYYKCILKK